MNKVELYKDRPGYQNLSDEQKVIADQWDKYQEIRFALWHRMLDAKQAGDKELCDSIYNDFLEIDNEFCAHDRSIFGSCIACDEIEKICRGLNPDEDYPEDDE